MDEATKKAKERAEELGVELDKVKGSGQDGRVTVHDVEAHADMAAGSEAPEPPPEPVHVMLNPASGLAAYAFADGFSIHADEPKYVAHEDYERYKNEKVEIAGVERRVLVKN